MRFFHVDAFTDAAGYQASARGGTVRVHWDGHRVTLAGQAVTVLSGTLNDGALDGAALAAPVS